MAKRWFPVAHATVLGVSMMALSACSTSPPLSKATAVAHEFGDLVLKDQAVGGDISQADLARFTGMTCDWSQLSPPAPGVSGNTWPRVVDAAFSDGIKGLGSTALLIDSLQFTGPAVSNGHGLALVPFTLQTTDHSPLGQLGNGQAVSGSFKLALRVNHGHWVVVGRDGQTVC
jgi:hypothetical protein